MCFSYTFKDWIVFQQTTIGYKSNTNISMRMIIFTIIYNNSMFQALSYMLALVLFQNCPIDFPMVCPFNMLKKNSRPDVYFIFLSSIIPFHPYLLSIFSDPNRFYLHKRIKQIIKCSVWFLLFELTHWSIEETK